MFLFVNTLKRKWWCVWAWLSFLRLISFPFIDKLLLNQGTTLVQYKFILAWYSYGSVGGTRNGWYWQGTIPATEPEVHPVRSRSQSQWEKNPTKLIIRLVLCYKVQPFLLLCSTWIEAQKAYIMWHKLDTVEWWLKTQTSYLRERDQTFVDFQFWHSHYWFSFSYLHAFPFHFFSFPFFSF